MTEAAKEARRQYRREWYRKNRDRVREHNERYWSKKAAAAADSQGLKEPGQLQGV